MVLGLLTMFLIVLH